MQVDSKPITRQSNFPVKYTRDGDYISPPVEWSQLPEQTRELALVFEKTTPETQPPSVLWLAYGIPVSLDGLAEGFIRAREPDEPVHLVQGKNDEGEVGYSPPLGSISRKEKYRLRVFALDRELALPPGADKHTVFNAMEGHVLDEAELQTQYQRPP